MHIIKIIAGFLALSLAVIGIFLPILPTTPFVLLAIGCFSATPKIRAWVLKIAPFREYYESYTKKRPLRWRTIIWSLLFLWTTLIVSMLLSKSLPITLLLIAVGIGVTIHILVMSRRLGRCRSS